VLVKIVQGFDPWQVVTEKKIRQRNVNDRFHVELEEDGGSSTGTELDGDK